MGLLTVVIRLGSEVEADESDLLLLAIGTRLMPIGSDLVVRLVNSTQTRSGLLKPDLIHNEWRDFVDEG